MFDFASAANSSLFLLFSLLLREPQPIWLESVLLSNFPFPYRPKS